MSEPVRVVVADDHQIVRDGLVALLGALDGIEVVGTAADGRDAVHVVGETPPDVVVMDIQMPAARRHRGDPADHRPRTRDVRVVMLTMNEDDDTVLSAIRAGASGYLLKGSGAEEVHARDPTRPPPAAWSSGPRSRRGWRRYFAGAAGAGRGGRSPSSPTGSGRCWSCSPPGARTTPSPRELYVSNKTVRNTVSVDLRQAARRRPGRGDHQGARGGAGQGLSGRVGRPRRRARADHASLALTSRYFAR